MNRTGRLLAPSCSSSREKGNNVPNTSPSPGRLKSAPGPSTVEEEHRFRSIAALLARENNAISVGKMMSSPALQYQGSVFAFYYGKQMVLRLGREFQPESFQIQQYQVLAPFKMKPPMVDWFEIPFAEQNRWENLARAALQRLAEQGAK